MTRNEQPLFDPGLYDQDFYVWTQQQAAALRSLPSTPAIDIAHVAEEIEDLGKRDVREVMSYLGLVILHLVKLRVASTSREAAHWHAEAVNFQAAARRAFSPGMRQLLNIDEAWHDGRRAAERYLTDSGSEGRPDIACPFKLDELLSANFDVEEAVARIPIKAQSAT